MPRKKKQLDATEAYKAVFPSRLRELMRRTNTTQAALAAHLGIARQSCAAYCDGSSSPTWEGVVKITQFFDCSSDYLLGLSDHKSKETEEVTLSQLGLSEQAIKNLMGWQCSDAMDGLNLILSGKEIPLFWALGKICQTKQLFEKALVANDRAKRPADLGYNINPDTGELTAWVGVAAQFSLDNVNDLWKDILKEATGYNELKEAMHKKMAEYVPDAEDKEADTDGIDTQEDNEGRQSLL